MAWWCASSSPHDGASTAVSSPRNELVKNHRVHPTHRLISTQVWTQSHFQYSPLVDLGGAPSAPAYWFFFIMLTINALYPGALYYYAARSSSRDADTVAALCDVTLDLS